MARKKLHKSNKERQEAAKGYRKVYYERNKVAILKKMKLKYHDSTSKHLQHPRYLRTTLQNSESNDTGDSGDTGASDLTTRLSEPQIKFHRLVNGSTHKFLDDLVLQYTGSTRSEDSRRPILDALDIAQEAEEAVTRSGDDGVKTLNPHHEIQRERKMVASEWTSKEQKEWLTAQLPGYQKCSTKSSYAKFWPPIYEQWEQQWPIYKELWPELPDEDGLNAVQSAAKGKAVKRRQKQLRTWMLWHSGNSASRKGRVAQSSTRATRLLKDLLQPRGARALSEAEMYSRLYYKTNIHPTVEAAVSERGSTTRGERLTIVREVTRQCWEREADETIIADVKARMKAKKKSRKANTDADDEDAEALEDEDEEEQSPTTEDMLEAQENLPAIFNTILTYLEHQTGFSFLVLMGGPDPSNNNKISVASVDVGTTKLGHSAPQLLPDFKEHFLGTYLKFLQGVQGYSSPEPEMKGDAKRAVAADNGEAGDGDQTDLEDQDEVDADPFTDEPEEEIEVSQSEGNVLDWREERQEQILDIYSPNYAMTMHDNPTQKPDTMHDSLQPINMHGLQQPINMHGLQQPEGQANLAMHDANSSYFANSTNFSNDGHSADLSQLLSNPQLWTFAPPPIYDPLQNFNSFNHFNPVPSYPYPQPMGYPQPSNYQPSNFPQPASYLQQSSGHLSHALPPSPPATDNSPSSSSDGSPPLSPIPTPSLSDGLPPLSPIPTPSVSDGLPPLPPVPTPSVSDGLPPLPPVPTPSPSVTLPPLPPVPTGDPPSVPAGLPQKAAGGKAKRAASTSQPEPTTRKSRRPPKPSTRNETANAIGANALSEMREKENTATVGGKKVRKHGLEAGGEPIAKYCVHFIGNNGH
ncbi:hypothetical protein BD769DRAFT_1674265 [Suillus cothurnatus]|nr:hypothetical protein BD769DRAFT_1674265 [Suillus cothurnatus]